MASVKDVIEKITNQLTAFSETPRLDAELLVGTITHQTRTELFTHPEKILSQDQQTKLHQWVERRLAQEPIAYIVGKKEFWSLDLDVNSAVLIPRPETEMLVEWLLENLPAEKSLEIADLGTGSGAIALALAIERPHWHIDATDLSAAALKVAAQNAKKHEIENVKFYEGEWCDALPHKSYHVIVGNPPYIKENDSHLPRLTQYEPVSALVSGVDGLTAIQKIMMQAREYLVSGGWLLLEHGYDQQAAVIQLMKKQGYQNVEDYLDIAKMPRMIVGQKP